MAIIRVSPLWEGRSGTRGKQRNYTQLFDVLSDSYSETVNSILDAMAGHATYPIYTGREYPTDPGSWCTGPKAENIGGPLMWRITAEYSSERELQQEPKDDPFEIEWDEVDYQRPVVKDRNGQWVLNSAGDPFSTPVMAEDSTRTCTVNFNTDITNPQFFRQFRKAINQDAITLDDETIPPKFCRVGRIRLGKYQYRGPTRYRPGTVVYEVRDADDGDWEIYLLDQGKRQIPTAQQITDSSSSNNPLSLNHRVPILNANRSAVTDDVPLDGNGRELINPSLTNFHEIEVPYYRLKTFGGVLPACVTAP